MTIHPHPTLSETLMESAEVFFGHARTSTEPKRQVRRVKSRRSAGTSDARAS